jgi:hypothetical protein
MLYYMDQRSFSQTMLAYEGEPYFYNIIQGMRAILAPIDD